MRAFAVTLFLALTAALPLAAQTTTHRWPERAVPRRIPMPPNIRHAYASGTRDSTGMPGPHYWQQSVDYRIAASLDVRNAVLHGRESITLHNTSPDTLHVIVLRLFQNYFTATAPRDDYVTDITNGDVMDTLVVNGTPIALRDSTAFRVQHTIAVVRLATPILPGADASVVAGWHFTVPNVARGSRGERMGRWGHYLYQVAQWYPQVAMYDDLRGWDADPYLGKGEFYNQFGRFDVRITVPAGWLVGATGTLANADSVLAPAVRQRLARAMRSDSTVHVVTATDRGAGKATAAGDSLTWYFTAPRVNDFAFMTARDAVWDAARAHTPNPTLVQALYLPEDTAYTAAVQVGRFALQHHAQYVMPYAFPQATVVDGPENGMEYPMIVFSSPHFGTETHELGHEWFPMMVSSNETWYGWQDEGFNDWIDLAAQADYTHKPLSIARYGAVYRRVAGQAEEPTLMWPSDWAGPFYEIQAYVKAPVALYALGGVVGDSAVHSAFQAYARAWQWKHPSPWDFFMFMQHHLGQDLGWFWNAWWFTTKTVDQGIASVQQSRGTARVTIVDHGSMAMPIILQAQLSNGRTTTVRAPASVWFDGTRRTVVSVPLHGARLTRLTLDPENRFQDLDRADNTWPAAH